MKKYLAAKKSLLISLISMLVILTVATFIEKIKGTPFAAEHVYSSWYFIGLWFIIAISAFIYLIQEKIYKRPMAFLIHLSFLVILTGAFLTFTTAKQGTIRLRVGKPANTFVNKKNNEQEKLPFDIMLSDFKVMNYPGTQAPSDYISYIKVRQNGEEKNGQISMNKIFSQNGYRFYQSGYDRDLKGSILMVKTDRYGLPVTYFGYALLFISMIGYFFSKKTGFREWLNHPALKKGAMIFFLFLTCHGAMAGEYVLPKNTAQKLGEVQMLYHDRIVPVQTFAKDLTLKLYGKSAYNSLTPEQVLSGWVLYPEKWMHEPIIKIKDQQVRQLLGINGKYASFSDFFTDSMHYKLAETISNIHTGIDDKTAKEVMAADEKVQLIYMLRMGIPLTIFPAKNNDELIWYSPADELPNNIPENEKLLITGYFDLLREYAADNDIEGMEMTLDKLQLFQRKKAGELLLSPGKIKAERLYNQFNVAKPIAFTNILLGIFALIYFFAKRRNDNKTPSNIITIILNCLLFLSLAGITILICLRGYISEHIPLGNGYETMQFLAACIMLSALLFQRKFFLFLPFGFLFSGLVLLVSGMGAANPQITQLQPVLNSPLLSIHVALIMMAYTLFGFVTFNSILALLTVAIPGKRKSLIEIENRITQQSVINRILLYPGVFLLAAGIFVGAIWAEVSWGTYWSWDPKETWALITMIIYGFAIHPATFSLIKKPLSFHIYTLFAFLSVLMTYFGVNYILGGMHSYGATFAQNSVIIVVISILVIFILLPIMAWRRYK